MKDRLSGVSVEELRAEVERRERRRELEGQRKERKIAQAVMTLGAYAESSNPSRYAQGDGEYEERVNNLGLLQGGKESSKELREHAAGVCRKEGLSAHEVAKIYAKKIDKSLDIREEFIDQISVNIAEVYRAISDPD